MKIIHKDWLDYFKQGMVGTSIIRIVSPFIKDVMVSHLLENREGHEIYIITRFNLNDFNSKVSSLEALERLYNQGAKIIGIKDLHSKTYIFDDERAIITSANFTNGGFFSNYEFGIMTEEPQEVQDVISYFDHLWKIGGHDLLSTFKINEWKKELNKNKTNVTDHNLPDYGKSITDKIIDQDKRYFVKFYGKGNERSLLNGSTKEMVIETDCHFALTFPEGNGRPRRYREGDIVFIARMVGDQDYAIMGKVIARAHVDSRDVASEKDIENVEWKKDYPIYIRVHSGEFLDTTFDKCPSLKQLMLELKGLSFESTKYQFLNGNVDINPKLSLRRRPDIELSKEGAIWLEQKFEEAKNNYYLIPDTFIGSLYQGTPEVK